MPRPRLAWMLTYLLLWMTFGTMTRAQEGATGEDIYRAACAACHGPDGRGRSQATVGFATPLPDFTDCAFASAEPEADWFAVVHEGGRVRGLARHMPAFGEALTSRQIGLVISHVRTFCESPAWPRGDLNLPRALFTEKAFPENEALWVATISRGADRAVVNELIYERRFGARNQIEVNAPVAFVTHEGSWQRGIGDLALAFKRTIHADVRAGRILSAGLEAALPTGDESSGLGEGVMRLEPFAAYGQILPGNTFVQVHAGAELPTDSERGAREAFVRAAFGATVAQERGFGRAWSPQIELLWARPEGGPVEWDVAPQIQISLSKLQHVLIAGGVRIPLTQRGERSAQVVTYLLWDWFDGGLFEFWK
jgi:mono/diheme cytochrome c family protein